MSETSYTVIAGRAILVGKSPDGDSVRFVPDHAALLRGLVDGDRVRISSDGSVQLRFDGVDAPELHYEGSGQPLGAAARDALLHRMGFTEVGFAPDGQTVTVAVPVTVPVVVLARIVEVNGRPVAVVFVGDEVATLAGSDGTAVDLTADLLGRSVNVWEVANGVVYPLAYTSTAPALRGVFVDAARTARAGRAGVWETDSTSSFPVSDAAALGPGGALIWPKLFRRAIDHLAHHRPSETLPEWLAANPLEDDDIHTTPDASGDPVPLHALLTQTGDRARLIPDLLDLVVVEREDPPARRAADPGAPQTPAL